MTATLSGANAPSMSDTPHALFWCDLETNSLDPAAGLIFEIAWVLTKFEYPYQPLAQDAYLVKHTEGVKLTGLDPFIDKMHTDNNLLTELATYKDQAETLEGIENELLALSLDWPLTKDERVVIAGSGAGFDKSFLKVHAPTFASRLSHRVFDTSSLVLSCRSMGMPRLLKSNVHRAGPDIEESMAHARKCASWMTSLHAVAKVEQAGRS